MTSLLEKAFRKASELPESIQDELAQELLEDIEAEFQWDDTFKKTEDQLEKLADKAFEDFKVGRAKKMGFDEL